MSHEFDPGHGVESSEPKYIKEPKYTKRAKQAIEKHVKAAEFELTRSQAFSDFVESETTLIDWHWTPDDKGREEKHEKVKTAIEERMKDKDYKKAYNRIKVLAVKLGLAMDRDYAEGARSYLAYQDHLNDLKRKMGIFDYPPEKVK